jgi:hypothetical protein
MKYFLYVFVLIVIVALIVNDEIDLVLPMSLTGFEVKKL